MGEGDCRAATKSIRRPVHTAEIKRLDIDPQALGIGGTEDGIGRASVDEKAYAHAADVAHGIEVTVRAFGQHENAGLRGQSVSWNELRAQPERHLFDFTAIGKANEKNSRNANPDRDIARDLADIDATRKDQTAREERQDRH